MRLDLNDEDFRRNAEAWLRSFSDDDLVDFVRVATQSPGYYPTTLHSVWRDEISRRGLQPRLLPPTMKSRDWWPVEHPEDSDWRFTPEAASALVELATAELAPGACVVHFGTPTTFQLAATTQPDMRHVLVERSRLMVNSLIKSGHRPTDVHCLDVSHAEAPTFDAQAAILDPPWYPADTMAFLIAASIACRAGAELLLCQPAIATRPAVSAERAQMLSRLPNLGLSLVATYAGLVRYLTPHFEAVTLRLADLGLPELPCWRVGDVMVLRKDRNIIDAAGAEERAAAGWIEAAFGPVRLKLRAIEGGEGDLASIVPGDHLATVSRREPARAQVGLWTSGNRVFCLVNAAPIAKLVDACDEDLARHRFTLSNMLEHAEHIGVVHSTARQLFDVLLLELQEHRAFERA